MTRRKLLLDADVIAYVAASSCEVATDWGGGYWTWHCDENKVKESVLSQIETSMATFKADERALCLTDSDGNWRRGVLPTYKGNRSGIKKPLVLKSIKEWMIEELGAYFRPTLEGDDCMGILATVKDDYERIIVSIDKDMKTIPGKFSRDGKTIMEISEGEADYWHLYQTLIGDITDGYTGLPNCGPVKAKKILGEPSADFSVAEAWPKVVEAYQKGKLGEEEALTQARVARILRASDYDFKKKEPILWTP